MDMARRRVDLRLEDDFLARVDAEAERLGQTRTKFIERALEAALDSSGVGSDSGGAMAPPSRVVAPAGSSPARSPKTTAKKPEALAEIRESLKTAKPPAGIPRIAPRHWAP